MKVEIIYESGEIREIEAMNSFHAHNIMMGSFYLTDEKGRMPIKAVCKEIGAEFWLEKDGTLSIKATDKRWLSIMGGKEDGKIKSIKF